MTPAGRKPKYDEPMVRRMVHLPGSLWEEIERYAADMGAKKGKPVSVAEAVRTVLQRAMKRRGR
jgi:hypothetical protein